MCVGGAPHRRAVQAGCCWPQMRAGSAGEARRGCHGIQSPCPPCTSSAGFKQQRRAHHAVRHHTAHASRAVASPTSVKSCPVAQPTSTTTGMRKTAICSGGKGGRRAVRTRACVCGGWGWGGSTGRPGSQGGASPVGRAAPRALAGRAAICGTPCGRSGAAHGTQGRGSSATQRRAAQRPRATCPPAQAGRGSRERRGHLDGGAQGHSDAQVHLVLHRHKHSLRRWVEGAADEGVQHGGVAPALAPAGVGA